MNVQSVMTEKIVAVNQLEPVSSAAIGSPLPADMIQVMQTCGLDNVV